MRVNNDMLVRFKEEIPLTTAIESLHLSCKLIHTGIISVDRVKDCKDYVLKKNDVVRIKAFNPTPIDFVGEYMKLHIVYEDDLLLIVDKPSGIMVHPDSKEGLGTLSNGVARYYEENGMETSVRPLHRLDTETSGLVIFSKSPVLQPHFDALLAAKDIQRSYYAFVDGFYRKGQKVTIEKKIGRDRHNAKKRRVSESGEYAKTHVECLASNREANVSLVKCQLETGRTHQIRVHLESEKHPLISDPLYGTRNEYIDHLALQAYALDIESPFYEGGLHLEIPMAKDLRKAFRDVLKLK